LSFIVFALVSEQPEQDSQNKTARTGQPERDRQNKTGRTGPKNRTGSIGRAEKDWQNQDRQNRTDRT
jgi:hypothetical protein